MEAVARDVGTVEREESGTAATPSRTGVPERLDELLALAPDELERLYAAATVPAIGDLRGALRGRMLAVVGTRGRAARALRAFASWDRFPWRGKSFEPLGESRGEGINRVVSDRVRLFRFETSIARSRAGAFDALQLDYDLPENPWIIRRIEDEVRELRPGLWLGQAYLRAFEKPRLVLYFGLATR